MEKFLSKKYPDLPGSKPVERAVQKIKRSGEAIPHTKEERISTYLDRFERLLQDENSFSLLKHKLLEKYVTKPEEIPEGYWQLQERIMRERGQGAEWDQASDEQKAEIKRQNSEGVLTDQRASLEQWIDHLAPADTDGMPRDLKYWAFRNIIGLQEYDKEKKEFPKRSKGTVKQFPDINHEALAYVLDAVMKKYAGKSIEFEHDIQPDEREAFNRFLEKEDFAKLYAWANELMNPIPEHLLPITEGEWRTFSQGSNHQMLVETVHGKGTGWCTAGENTAKKQLESGDFHIFCSLDDDGQPTIPRIAIRKEGDAIAEVRGIAHKQNLDPYMGEVLCEKLKEFPDGDLYLKKERDMRLLTVIEKKVNEGTTLTRDELVFLYEIDDEIDNFGYSRDPRIEQIKGRRDLRSDAGVLFRHTTLIEEKINRGETLSKEDLEYLYEINAPAECFKNQKDPRIAEFISMRNIDTDLPVFFDCTPEQIAHSVSEISEHTKVYIGELEPGIFDVLPRDIGYIYTKFPGGERIKFRSIEFDDNINNKSGYQKSYQDHGVGIKHCAKDMLEDDVFIDYESKYSGHVDLVEIPVGALYLKKGSLRSYYDVFTRANEIGLRLCTPEIGLQFRLQYKNQPMFEHLLMAMKEFDYKSSEDWAENSSEIFDIYRDENGLCLGTESVEHSGGAPAAITDDYRFVFLCPRSHGS